MAPLIQHCLVINKELGYSVCFLMVAQMLILNKLSPEPSAHQQRWQYARCVFLGGMRRVSCH